MNRSLVAVPRGLCSSSPQPSQSACQGPHVTCNALYPAHSSCCTCLHVEQSDLNLGLDGIAQPGEKPGTAISGWEPEGSFHDQDEDF